MNHHLSVILSYIHLYLHIFLDKIQLIINQLEGLLVN